MSKLNWDAAARRDRTRVEAPRVKLDFDRPSAKQIALLQRLAAREGVVFVYPATKQQASKEIDRLLGKPK